MTNEAVQHDIHLGDKVRDTVTGFEGIVIGVTTWMYGCDRVVVQSQTLKDGLPTEGQAFDVLQVVKVEAEAVPADKRKRKTGGPQVHERAAMARR